MAKTTKKQGNAVWKRLRKNKMAMVGLLITLTLIVLALLAPVLAPADPYAVNLRNALKAPGEDGHLLGTDQLGRDQFSRLLYGAQISLRVGLITQSITVVIGIFMGALAGYYGGKVDEIISYFINVFFAFPSLLFAIAIMATLGPGLNNIFIALGAVSWPGLARIVRGQVMQLKEREYIEAVKALGGNDFQIIMKHIIPNCMAPVIVTTTLGVAGAILSEAGLSFLGLGAQPPTPSWGLMLATGRTYITSKSWLTIYPGLAIMFTILGLNLLGDGLRDALDPRLKQ
ncbi:MAG: ABC transporter permease [Halanaerobiales bacterium]|nr:ABC transporter permease [Halanaerobiales bacterium]